MRTERCLCGGSISAPSLAAAAPYVEAHGLSEQHRLWRVRAGRLRYTVDVPSLMYDPERERPTAWASARDLSGRARRASAAAVRGEP